MKKIKIMLIATTVMAVVGGALAFKAKRTTYRKLCTGTQLNECFNLVVNSMTTHTGEQLVYYTVVQEQTNCNFTYQCFKQTYLIPE